MSDTSKIGKNVESNHQFAQCLTSKYVFLLADGKMANSSLDVHTFIAQHLPKYRF